MPATSQLDWLISMTAMIVLFWSRATRDLLKSFGWGIAGTPSISCSDEVAIPRHPPHSVSRSPRLAQLSRLMHAKRFEDIVRANSDAAAVQLIFFAADASTEPGA